MLSSDSPARSIPRSTSVSALSASSECTFISIFTGSRSTDTMTSSTRKGREALVRGLSGTIWVNLYPLVEWVPSIPSSPVFWDCVSLDYPPRMPIWLALSWPSMRLKVYWKSSAVDAPMAKGRYLSQERRNRGHETWGRKIRGPRLARHHGRFASSLQRYLFEYEI